MKVEDIWRLEPKGHEDDDPWDAEWDPYDIDSPRALRRGTLVRLHDWTLYPGSTGVILGQEFCPGAYDAGPEHLMYTVLVDGKTHTLIYDDLEEIR